MKMPAAQTITRFLAGTSLSILIATPAFADGNSSFVAQDGLGNTARIDQDYRTGVTGIGNNRLPRNNRVGRSLDPVRQDGALNVLNIFQGSVQNRVGAIPRGDGIDQIGDRNTLDIIQIGQTSRVNQIRQTGAALATTAQNTATVLQTNAANRVNAGASHRISNIAQTNTGGVAATANVVFVEQIGTDSFVGRRDIFGLPDGGGGTVLDGIVQNGSGNTVRIYQRNGDTQTLRLLDQDGTGNTALVHQEAGSGNTFDLIDQSGGGAGALANSVDLTFTGDGNGAAFTGSGFADLGTPAASTVTQLGMGNTLALTVEGDSNAFGAIQNGDDNVIGSMQTVGAASFVPVSLLGDFNELAIAQTSSGNVIDIPLFTGDANIVGIEQTDTSGIGGFNTVTLSLNGSDNAFRIHQDGANTVDLTIDGDGNGGTAAFSGVAEALRVATTAYDLSPGIVAQTGAGNTVSLDIRGDAGGVGSGNLFAIVQDGGDNSVDGLQAGIGNEVAILQSGSFNAVTFTQQGSFNVLAISQ